MTGISSEQLRRTVVRAAMPLIVEYETLTMARMAQAAGIDEADLLAVFADKDAVIQACVSVVTAHMTVAMDPAVELRKLDAIRVDQPIAARLAEVIDILGAYYQRIRDDLKAFEQANFAGDEPITQSIGRNDFRDLGSRPEIRQAVAKLLEPDEQRLHLPAETLADIFLLMSRACVLAPNEVQPRPADQVIGVFLHGALIAQ